MKKVVHVVFFGCNLVSEPMNENLANELKEKLLEKEIQCYVSDEDTKPLDIYKKEVQVYQEWLGKVTEGYTEDQLKNLIGMLDTPDYDKARIWTGKLEGIAMALNLTKEETEKIDALVYMGM